MKKIFPLVCFLVLAGCSSSYRVSDFPTKENFYEDFNNAARNMYLNINMINDSLISVKYGANISNDTLIMTTQIQTEGKRLS